MVLDKKVWWKGPTEKEQRCVRAAAEIFARLPPTEPYVPNECEGLYVHGLTLKDFHLFVDGVEQRIQRVTTETQGLRVRDNLGLHNAFSQSSVGTWSTSDYTALGQGYGSEAGNQYEVSFVPDRSDPAGCHQIQVKVDRQDSIVHARPEYCTGESPFDILSGSAFGKQLERDLASGQPGKIAIPVQAGVFHTNSERGRVRIALEFPWDSLRRQWGNDWRLDASIGTLGMAYGPDGSPATRFGDFACCSPYSTASVFGTGGEGVNEFFHRLRERVGQSVGPSMLLRGLERAILPSRYETQVDLPAGEYYLRVVLGDGEKFGRAEAHLNIEKYDGTDLALSSVMLCKRFRDAHVAAVEAAAANFAPQYVPMVSNGIQVTPAGDTSFKTGEPLIPYFEIYAPQGAAGGAARIQAHLRIVDAKSGALVKDFPPVDAATYTQPGNTTIPVAREVPIAALPKGEYRLEVQASDSTGRTTPWRAANFTIAGEK
jgi:hypothetical protein